MRPVCESVDKAPPLPAPGRFSTRTQIMLAGCLCAGTAALVYAVDPSQHAIYPHCLFYEATGFYCAGCGATRALHALLHGHLATALHDNALFVLGLPVVLFFGASYVGRAWRAGAWPIIDLPTRKLVGGVLGLVILALLFMLARNLPGWPFDMLKPLS